MAPDLAACFPPRAHRVHEAFGAGKFSFAAALMAQIKGPVIWISEAWQAEGLNPHGLADYIDPERLLMARSKDQAETLALTEESLRSGAVGLCVAELTGPLGLTSGRRLQLAAEEGRSMGLCLIGYDQGSNAAETRWHCQPVADPEGAAVQHWELVKNKRGATGAWRVLWDSDTRALKVL